MNGIVIGSVVSGHLHIKLGDCSIQTDISEFFVHVVVACSRLILEDDTISFDGVVVSLEDLSLFVYYLVDTEDLSLGTLELLLLSHVIPKLGLGNDGILGKDSESEHSGAGISGGRVSSAEDEVLSDLS